MVKYSGSGLRQPAMAKRKLQRIATTFAFHLKPPKRQAPDNCIGQKKKMYRKNICPIAGQPVWGIKAESNTKKASKTEGSQHKADNAAPDAAASASMRHRPSSHSLFPPARNQIHSEQQTQSGLVWSGLASLVVPAMYL